MNRRNRSMFLMAGFLAVGAIPGWVAAQQLPANATVYGAGLEGPRGLRFGPDGFLYVAEAGTGGSFSTGTACTQVPPPVGPYTGGPNSRISKIRGPGSPRPRAAGEPPPARGTLSNNRRELPARLAMQSGCHSRGIRTSPWPIRSTHRARHVLASKGSAKYCVSRATLSPLNSMMLTV
jgi:hypothetical protein